MITIETCSLVSNSETVALKGNNVVAKSGSYLSRNVKYLAFCSLCTKGYIGKTTTTLRSRVNGHRATHRKIIRTTGSVINVVRTKHQDDLSLGYHLFKEHGSITIVDKYFKF